MTPEEKIELLRKWVLRNDSTPEEVKANAPAYYAGFDLGIELCKHLVGEVIGLKPGEEVGGSYEVRAFHAEDVS